MTEWDVRSAYQRKTTNEHLIKLSIRLTADVMTLDLKKKKDKEMGCVYKKLSIAKAVSCFMFYFLLFSSFYRSMALVIASRDKSTAVLNSFMTSDLYHLETI